MDTFATPTNMALQEKTHMFSSATLWPLKSMIQQIVHLPRSLIIAFVQLLSTICYDFFHSSSVWSVSLFESTIHGFFLRALWTLDQLLLYSLLQQQLELLTKMTLQHLRDMIHSQTIVCIVESWRNPLCLFKTGFYSNVASIEGVTINETILNFTTMLASNKLFLHSELLLPLWSNH